MSMVVFWVVTPHVPLGGYQCQGWRWRHYVTLKRWYPCTSPYDIIILKAHHGLCLMCASLTGAQVMEFCPHGTKVECTKVNAAEPCKKLHFKKIIQKHTDESLGDCSFLNTCFHMDTCKYVLLNARIWTIIILLKYIRLKYTQPKLCQFCMGLSTLREERA
jgi:hypothetical protein